MLDAVARVGHQFGHRLNDPAELKRQQTDPSSEYNEALARELNTTVEQAIETVKKAKAKAKVFVTVMEKELKQHFKYHCPFCGRVDSPDCAYINESLAWKIEHSTKKPWTEEIIKTRIEEQEIEIDVKE